MSDVQLWLSIALGVLVAVIYPVLYRYILQEFPPTAAIVSPWLKQLLKKYGSLFVFSLITAFVVLGLYRSTHPDTKLSFWAAVCLGFGFESSVEKIVFPKSTNQKAG